MYQIKIIVDNIRYQSTNKKENCPNQVTVIVPQAQWVNPCIDINEYIQKYFVENNLFVESYEYTYYKENI